MIRPRPPVRLTCALVVLLAGAPARAQSTGDDSGRNPDPAPAPQARSQQRNVLSPVYTIDRIYKSMQGPMSRWDTLLADDFREPELLWLTGFHTTIVAPNGLTSMSQEFMCHSNLDLNHRLQAELLNEAAPDAAGPGGSRIATISQGLQDIEFPKGFGIPFPSIQPLFVTSQVLNHNLTALTPPLQVRHRVRLSYVRDHELAAPLTPLYPTGLSVMVSLQDGEAYFDTVTPSNAQHGASCAPGLPAMKGGHLFTDRHNQHFTAHWVVKPGHEERRTLVTGMLSLEYDTTIHYIAVHLHPFAQTLTLRDLTAGKDLFVSHAKNAQGKIGLESVDAFSSAEGIPVFKGHEYELISVYDNTTDRDQDAMAVMYVFLADKAFAHDRAVASLETLRQKVSTMDKDTYLRWVQHVRQAAASDQ